MFQSPPKGATIPYRPKPQVGGPVILAGGQAYTIQGNYAVPAHSDVSIASPVPLSYHPPVPPHPALGQCAPALLAFSAAGHHNVSANAHALGHGHMTDVSRSTPRARPPNLVTLLPRYPPSSQSYIATLHLNTQHIDSTPTQLLVYIFYLHSTYLKYSLHIDTHTNN